MDSPRKRLSDLSSRKQELLARLLKQQPDAFNTFPLSSAQHQLWFLDRLAPGSTVYSVPVAVRLTGALDLAALTASLDEIIRRHETLRTTIVVVDGQPVQAIGRPQPIALPLVSLAELGPEEQAAQMQRLIAEEIQQPFDLERGPLIRAKVFRLASTEHVLLVLLHHVICDGWSLGVLVRELAAWYAAAREQRRPDLPTLPIQYADYAVWQQQWMQSADAEKDLDYWRAQLANVPPVLHLPTDFPRPAALSQRGTSHSFQIPAALTDALHDLSQHEGVTLFMTLLATFQILLFRYSGQSDLLVGTPTAGRRRAELEGLIGCFVNTVALRGDLSGNPSFRTLLQRVRAVTLQAYAHQYLPFDRVVAEVQPERSMQAAPLVQVFFVLQNAPLPPLELADVTMRRLPIDPGTAQYDLTLNLEAIDGQLWGKLEYSTDLFAAETIARMAGHLQTLLQAIVDDPDARIATLPLLTAAEQQLLIDGSRTTAEYAHEITVHQLIEALAAHAPETIAVADAAQELTYAALNARANQLAHYLLAQGVRPEMPVALCVQRSPEMIVGMLAILKAGGCYVPLDPAYPAERLQFMLADSRASLLLTQTALMSQLPKHPTHIVCLDDWDTLADYPATNPAQAALPENLAYIIYTSGSTGQPKGVAVTHRSLSNLISWHQRTFQLTAQDRMSQLAGMAFDAMAWEVWPALAAGACLVLPDEATRTAPEALQDWLQTQQISLSFAPTPLAERLLALDWSAPTTLRTLLTGGDTLHRYPPAQLPFALINNYGPTESTVVATSGPVPSTSAIDVLPALGQPIANTQLYLLDAALQPVPRGVPGAIYLGGAGLARGYLNRPDLTAERFIPAPFGPAGSRLYHTGDLARYRADGSLEFLGRSDQQVKVRGFRIELEEIEAVLATHPQVRETAVLVHETAAGDRRLVAYVTEKNLEPRTKNQGDESEAGSRFLVAGRPLGMAPGSPLREFLAQRLPAYMVPSAFVTLDALPLTPNGKIDRRALLKLSTTEQESAQRFVAPRTPIEQQLAALWSAVLDHAPIGVHDDFFALGGHSLLVTRLVTRINAAFQVDLPLRTLFDAPTIARVAERVLAAQQTSRQQLPPIRALDRDRPLPLSFAQQRLWLLQQLTPDDASYNIPLALQLAGHLDVAALHASLNLIVARHEVLRTTFGLRDGEPVQQIAPTLALALPLIDLSDLPAAERERQVVELARAEAQQPFDLQRGPLLRAALLRLAPDEHRLLLTLHHIAADGWSTSILIRELSAAYTAYHSGAAPALPGLPIQYADYAVWQRGWLQGDVLDRQLSYWRQQFAGPIPVLDLPTDYPRPATIAFGGAEHTLRIDPELTAQLHALSQREGATLFMTLLTTFEVLLYRYTGQTDLVVGTPIAGRATPEVEPLIGFFVNMLALRADLSGSPPFRDLLARVRESCLAAYAHQDLPFEQLVEALQPERDLSRTPIFQILFALQNTPGAEIALPELTATPVDVTNTTAKYDLSCALTETAGGLVCTIEYRTDLFAATTIERLAGHFQTLLGAVVRDPARPIERLPLLPDAERQVLLHDWNTTQAAYAHEPCLHTAVTAQAARTPDAIAVVYQDQTLTYRELNDRANQLAHYLQSHGARDRSNGEVRIGIMMEPSIEMIVGLMAVLKLGGCYVPLDPAYPAERLRWLFGDSQIALVLTQQHLLHPEGTRLPDTNLPALCLDRDWSRVAACPTTDPAAGRNPDQLAYMIYTSGSTGRPKGVMITHRSVLNNLMAHQAASHLAPDDRVLLNYSISFDPSVWSIFWPLITGARLVLVPSEVRYDSAALVRAMAEQGVSVFGASPSQLAVLIEEPGIVACTRLRYVVSGGESLPRELQQRFFSRVNAILCNCYGPTEGTIDTTFWVCPRSEEPPTPLIGRPLPNVEVYVLDRQMEPAPIGVPGELYVGGVQLARGYHQRPDLTAEKFVANPFSADPGTRLYRTGDLVRFTVDSQLEFLGRIDQQVKLRGFRIELGEIESLLAQHPAVQEAVVVVRADRKGDQRLVAYVTEEPRTKNLEPGITEQTNQGTNEQSGSDLPPRLPQPRPKPAEVWGRGLEGEGLRRYLQSRLPDYMVPAAFVTLDVLPLTANGKLDRAALPTPELGGASLDASFVAPRTPIEELLVGIWADVLRLDRVGVFDNFFELGGQSLIAAQLMARVREACQVEIPLRALFERPTIAGLADIIEQAAQSGMGNSAPLVPVSRDQPLPLSFAQQRLWFLDQLEPNSPLYNVPTAVKLAGRLDVAALHWSLDQIARRHEILRTTFAADNTGQPRQIIAVAPRIELAVVDLHEIDPVAREAEVARLAAREARQPFDLQHGPLIRTILLHLDDQAHVLLLTMHHIIADGWSMGILIRELATFYAAFADSPQPEQIALPALPIQYADYAAWQHEWLQAEMLDQQLAYWKQQLGPEGTPAPSLLKLATDRPRPEVQTYAGRSHSFTLPPSLLHDLVVLSRREGTTLFMTTLAAFNVLLHWNSGQDDIVVGSPIAGRSRVELEPLIGFFINTLVLRTRLAGQATFADLLRQVRETTLGAYAHQDLPFERLVEALQPDRSLSHLPLFQVWFVLQNIPMPALELPGLTLSLLDVDHGIARYDLRLGLIEGPDELSGSIEYNSDLFDAATIAHLATLFATLLTIVAARPQTSLDELKATLNEAHAQHQASKQQALKNTVMQKLKQSR
ncbi:MAG TPA: amino acid adenylation domain-containing protein, partial [Herpetosiphonaceae bacterium]